jgi:hypothetical protein
MSKGIADTLNMKTLEELLAETEADNFEDMVEETVEETQLPAAPAENALMTVKQMKGSAHAEAMDELYHETLDVARKIVDMGMNIDPAKAPRMFEVANQLFKTAQDSAISKRDAELKLMKLIQDQKKLEIEQRRLSNELGEKSDIEGNVVMVEDRNTLLKMLREQRKNEEKPDA